MNARNCLGCTPLLYACGSGHVETVRALLSHPEIDVNRRNNDRLTSFMLAMQVQTLSFTVTVLGNRKRATVSDSHPIRGFSVQSGAARHSQGFEDKNLGSSPGLLGQ